MTSVLDFLSNNIGNIIVVISHFVVILVVLLQHRLDKFSINSKVFLEKKHDSYSRLQNLLVRAIPMIYPIQRFNDFLKYTPEQIKLFIDKHNIPVDKTKLIQQLENPKLMREDKEKLLEPLYDTEKQEHNKLYNDLHNYFTLSSLYISEKIRRSMKILLNDLEKYKWIYLDKWERPDAWKKNEKSYKDILKDSEKLIDSMRKELISTKF